MFRRAKGLEFGRFFSPGKGVLGLASRKVVSVQVSDSVQAAIGLMLEGYRKIPVVKRGIFRGIVTVNDVLDYCGAGDRYQEFLKSEKPLQEPVSGIMDTRVVKIDAGANLKKTMEVFKDFGRGSYPVVKRGRPVGVVADWDFIKKIRGKVGVRVGSLMVRRPAQARESYSLLDAAKIMVRGGYRRLPVTKHGILTGIILPSDVLSALQGLEGAEKLRVGKGLVSQAMREDVVVVSPQEDVSRAITLMLKSRVGGLPVTEDRELVGIITESDIVQGML